MAVIDPATNTQEESIDRPDPEDLKMYGAKLKPHYSRFEEDLVSVYVCLLGRVETDGWRWPCLSRTS